MVSIVSGNALDVENSIIVHQVNCKGVMGKGIAKQIKEKYPEVYLAYKTNQHELGTVLYIDTHDDNLVANFYSQDDYAKSYGEKDKVYTNYEAFRKWICPKCGTAHDRDINASKNLLKLAM